MTEVYSAFYAVYCRVYYNDGSRNTTCKGYYDTREKAEIRVNDLRNCVDKEEDEWENVMWITEKTMNKDL